MRLDELEAAIREERPDIDAEFAALLDDRAAAGFPREGQVGGARGVAERLRMFPPRRLIAPAGAVATALVITGVAITALGGSQGGSGKSSSAPLGLLSRPSQGSRASTPTATTSSRAQPALRAEAEPAVPAPRTRKVARNANLTLSTDPRKVRTVADGVVQVTRRYHGLVVSSQITSGKGGSKPAPGPVPEPIPYGPSLGAEFQLRIPAAKVEPALDDLSRLGLVVSRTEGTQDITGRFVSARQRIGNLVSERDALIKRLASAVTTEAIDTIKHRLAVVRHLLVRAQGELNQLRERVWMVPVHVSVVARGAGAGTGGGGSFDIGDALHDAGRVLTVAAGIVLISLAVLAPLAVIGLLAWLAGRAALRARRERALSEHGL